jgi:hypothetical protein
MPTNDMPPAYQEGRQAYRDGVKLHQNPHQDEVKSWRWMQGWRHECFPDQRKGIVAGNTKRAGA